MRSLHRDATKKLNEIATERAEKYDSSPIIQNMIHDRMPEDDRLRHVVDVMVRAYRLEKEESGEVYYDDDVHRVAFNFAEALNDEVELVADQVERNLLRDLATRLSRYPDRYAEEELDRANAEFASAGIAREVDDSEKIGSS